MFRSVDNTEQFKADINTSKSDIVEESFGLLYGKVYFIKVSPNPEDIQTDDLSDNEGVIKITQKDAANILNRLDTMKHGRKAEEVLNYFSGGSFIMTRTDENALEHHHLYTRSLHSPKVYVENILSALQAFLNNDLNFTLKDLTVTPVRNALATGMLGTNGLTPELHDAIKAFSDVIDGNSDDIVKAIKTRLLGASWIGWLGLNTIPEYKRARSNYFNSALKFMSDQAENILNELHNAANGEKITNIIALSIIRLIIEDPMNKQLKEDKQQLNQYLKKLTLASIQKYLSNSTIITIPASITAGDNTMIVLSCIFNALFENEDLLEKFRGTIHSLGLFNDLNAERIAGIIKADKLNHGPLHCFYLEALRREDYRKSIEHLSLETMNFRYTDQDFPISETKVIPANSTIAILPATTRFDKRLWDKPEAFNPDRYLNNRKLEKYALSVFSNSHRRCPAYDINEYIIITFAAYIASHYDFKLENTEEKKAAKIHVSLTPIKQPELTERFQP